MARIVVADDDADIRDLVVFKLRQAGHDVQAVEDGAAAVEACQVGTPDLAAPLVQLTTEADREQADHHEHDGEAEDEEEGEDELSHARLRARTAATRDASSRGLNGLTT